METFLEILKFTLPSLIVFATAYVMIRNITENNNKKNKHELSLNTQKQILPIRLQAYERVIMFLERISPDSLLLREMNPAMTSVQFQATLLKSIRTEYEHNLSQQIYISTDAWKIMKGAKENVIKLINTIAAKVEPAKPAIELSRNILELMVKAQVSPTSAAIEFIKNEIRQNF